MKTIKELEKNEHLISDLKTEDGKKIRIVDDKKIIQIKEKTQEDIDFNRRCNLWRMRNKN